MKKPIKAAVSLIFTALILFSLSVAVFAEDKQYSVDSAVFSAKIMNDGSVYVTEEWTVSFEKGDFTRFYKDIHADKKEESFSHFEIKGVWIDCKHRNDPSSNNYLQSIRRP